MKKSSGHKSTGMRHDDARLGSSHSNKDQCYKTGGAVTHPGHKFAEERRLKKSQGGKVGSTKW